MQNNKYQTTFTSQNNDSQKFTLTFEVDSTKHVHIVTDAEVYQHRTDTFCTIKKRDVGNRHSLEVRSLCQGLKFSIDIYIEPDGCKVYVVESVVTIIASETKLQPCNR